VPGIGDLSQGPFAALALSATAVCSFYIYPVNTSTYIYLQVERALTLWRDGCISCETVAALKAKKRSSAIIKTINKATGKESTKTTDFNQANWATITNGYLSSIKKALSSPSKFNPIIDAAKRFVKATSRIGDTTAFDNTAEEDKDVRAFLCDDEDSDLDCE
jgi:lysozyme family protein